ncbi:MAG: tetratricopeptide repeat protein [Candidatus Eisenbacteria bacterium]
MHRCHVRRFPLLLFFLNALFLSAFSLTGSSPAQAADDAGGSVEQACFDRAAVREMAGDHAGALKEYRAFLAEHPDHERAPLAAMAAANLEFLALGEPDAAVAAYDLLVSRYPGSVWAPEAARRKAECLQASEQWEPAGRAYGQALTLAGSCAEPPRVDWMNEVSLAAADCFDRAGNQAQVIEIYEGVLQNPLPSEAAAMVMYRLGERYEAQAQPAQAAARYARLIHSYPASRPAGQAIGKRALIEAHEPLDWDSFTAYAAAGDSIRQRHYAGALPKLDQVRSASRDPVLLQCVEFRQIVAETMISSDFTAGLSRLERFLDTAPHPEALPDTEPLLQNYRALAGAEERARANPDDLASLRALGDAYLQSQAIAKGIEVLERARALDSANADVQFSLGRCYLAAGRGAEAQQAFGVYLEQNPQNTAALNMIGYSCLGAGDAESAIVFFERYAAADPDDPNAHDSLGEGYLAAGRLEEAAREYERAVEIDPGFVNSYFMMAGAYRQLGRTEDAVARYNRFLELSPVGDQADQARAALAEIAGAAD